MTAVAPSLMPTPWPVLRPRPAPPRHRRRTAAPPTIRPGRPRRAVYWRRRAVAVVVALTGALALGDAAGAVFGGGAVPVAGGGPRVVRYVVAPGDTLWRIARRLEPRRDPREVVDALVTARHTTVVVPGEVIEWAGL